MSSAMVVYNFLNSLGRPLKLFLIFFFKSLWKIICIIFIAIFFIPMTMINFTFNANPKDFKEFLNPFSYGIIGSWFEPMSFDEMCRDENDFAVIAVPIVLIIFTAVGIFLVTAFPLACVIRLYIQGLKEKQKEEEIEQRKELMREISNRK